MKAKNNSNPLEGKTLKTIITELEAKYGWEQLGQLISIKCFNENPSINSSLKFLRQTPWARTKVEELYCQSLKASAYGAKKSDESKQY